VTADVATEAPPERVCARCGHPEGIVEEPRRNPNAPPKRTNVVVRLVQRHRRPPELECARCWSREFHEDAPPVEELRLEESWPERVRPNTVDLTEAGRCVLCGAADDDMTTATMQGLLTREDGRPIHVAGPRCSDCRAGVDRYGDARLFAAIQRGQRVEERDGLFYLVEFRQTDLWVAAALEGAEDPPGPWQF
jgi:hypothetical protein